MNIKIDHDWTTGRFSIHVLQRTGNRIYSAEPAALTMREVGDYAPGASLKDRIKPWLEIDQMVAAEFFSALAAELARMGFTAPDPEKKNQADAMKMMDNHLQDMRRLVFKGDPNFKEESK